jgi:hypothetical protein
MTPTGWASLADTLADLDFPATREQIVDHALDTRADHDVLRLIRGLPVATYPDLAAVRERVSVGSAPT